MYFLVRQHHRYKKNLIGLFILSLKIDCLKTPFIGVLVCKAIRLIIVLQANNPEMNLGTRLYVNREKTGSMEMS